jgi:hypothetical protein
MRFRNGDFDVDVRQIENANNQHWKIELRSLGLARQRAKLRDVLIELGLVTEIACGWVQQSVSGRAARAELSFKSKDEDQVFISLTRLIDKLLYGNLA